MNSLAHDATYYRNFDWNSVVAGPNLGRDDVISCIEHRGSSKFPMSFGPVPLCFRNEELYDFFRKWPDDLEYLTMYLEPRRFADLMQQDGLYLHGSSSIKHLVDDWSQFDTVIDRLMPPVTAAWWDLLAPELAKTPGRYHCVVHVAFLFELLYVLRGMERFFIDLYDAPEQVARGLDRIVEYTCALIPHYGKAGLDAFMIGDDWGSQRSLLIDPDLWRKLFKPCYKRCIDACHASGLQVWFHSDGNLDAILPDMVEIGVDVFHPLQPNVMAVDHWIAEYRNVLTFWTGVDVQGMLPFASPQGVKDAVHREVERFQSTRGGFILGPTNALTAEVPYENLVALHETLLEYR
jgi:hypothetical protein